jgi:uncharacterized membrane-anchored protein
MSTETESATSATTSATNDLAKLAGVVLISLALVAAAVFPQLTARLTGDEYQFRVAPFDPIDPFRGAYVDLAYPDIQAIATDGSLVDPLENDQDRGDLYITLVRDGDVWAADEFTRTRPESGPFLSCSDRDFRIRCGIESLFLPQDSAKALEDAVREGTAIATVRVDSRGNAALMDVSAP